MGFLFLILLSWIAYWAYVSMTDVTTGQPLTASTFNEVLENIRVLKTTVDWIGSWTNPTWAVMAFNLSSCPSWWIPANGTSGTPDLRWTFIRWMNWSVNWRDVSRTLWDYQVDDFKSHTHTYWAGWSTIWAWWWNISYVPTIGTTSATWWSETRPKNVALLYCVKQ